jgi:hypothetical protein
VLRTRAKTALFSTRKKNSEKKFSFLFIEQIVILFARAVTTVFPLQYKSYIFFYFLGP